MDLNLWLAFFAACWVISLSPGTGAIASMSSGMRCGFTRGYWNVVGLQLALVLQIVVVATGLGAVLTASALAFNLIKWFGVGYLVYLAYKQWQQTTTEMPTDTSLSPRLSPAQLVGKGFLVNISNPKAIVFILAVLPQFLDPTQPLFTQYVAMALTMVGVDMLVMAGYTGLAVKVLVFLKSPHQQKILNRSFAGLFLGAASALSLVHRSN